MRSNGIFTRRHGRLALATVILFCAPSAAQGPDARIVSAARELMREARYCALITLDAEGQPQARAMDPFPPEADLTVWLATRRDTRKVEQIRRDPRATLYYFDRDGVGYVTLLGEAELVEDRRRREELWKPEWAPFYDGENLGQEYLLLRFRPHRLEVVSMRHGIASEPRAWKPAIVDLKR